MARPCWVLLQSALAVLAITGIIATTASSMDSSLYQGKLPATPAQKMSVLWTIEFLNSRIHVENRRLIRNQKQNNRDALIYLASSSRNIDPRTMSVIEGIPQNGATLIEWKKQWVQAAQVFWVATKLLFHPLLLSPRQMNVVTVAEPKVQFPQRLLPFQTKAIHSATAQLSAGVGDY